MKNIKQKWAAFVALFWALVLSAVTYDAEAFDYARWTSKSSSTSGDASFGSVNVTGSTCPVNGLYLAGSSQLGVCTNSSVVADFFGASALQFGPTYSLAWMSSTAVSGSQDLVVTRDAADTLAQRRGTNAQTFRIYNTFTDASNYERGHFFWNGNNFDIQTAQAGTGTARQMRIFTTGSAKVQFGVSNSLQWEISTGGAFEPVTDGSPDIGATSNRVKDFIGARLRSSQATAPTCTSNCGISPSVAGGDTAGIVTMGSSGVPNSGWVVTFNGTWAAAPSCIVQSALATMVVGKMPIAVVTTTTTMTVTTNGTGPATSDKYAYHCIGVQ